MSRRKIILWVVAGVMALVLASPFIGLWLMSKGRMPRQSAAVAIRDDALKFAQEFRAETKTRVALPDSIAKLHPLGHTIYPSGVLLIFRETFAEGDGYFYLESGQAIPKEIAPYSKEISPGVYRFCND